MASGPALPPALCSWKEVTQTLEQFPRRLSQASASWGSRGQMKTTAVSSRAAPWSSRGGEGGGAPSALRRLRGGSFLSLPALGQRGGTIVLQLF